MIDPIGTLRRLTGRVNAMVARCVINVVNDSMKTQRAQITIQKDEVVPDVELMQPYGISFVPPAGSEALALAITGRRSYTVALCADDGQRPTGNPPKTGGLYTQGEWRVFLDEKGHVHLGAQVGASKVALADKFDVEIQRIWDVLTSSGVVPAPPTIVNGVVVDAGQPGLIALKQLATAARAQVQSVSAEHVSAT